ncbi:hypothetical protein BGW80DRAFT_1425330 [Lactifluus volemus]|nr:hypothetical protein BGW80DRAFT_1425330 [Lactifluus volemus]
MRLPMVRLAYPGWISGTGHALYCRCCAMTKFSITYERRAQCRRVHLCQPAGGNVASVSREDAYSFAGAPEGREHCGT